MHLCTCKSEEGDDGEPVVYYESLKRELKTKPIYEFRYDERRQTKVEEFTLLVSTLFIFCLL